MDAGIGLDADGIDNEMSFSHLDRNIVFDPTASRCTWAGTRR